MLEWVAVSAAGGLGGIFAVLFAERVRGEEHETPETPAHFAEKRHWLRKAWDAATRSLSFCYTLGLNAGGGATASVLLWATYTSSLNFDSTKFTPSEIAAAITVGLGGVGAVRGLMHESTRATELERAAASSASAAALFAEASALKQAVAAESLADAIEPIDEQATLDLERVEQ